MKKKKLYWSDYRKKITRINQLSEDWLTPAEFLPYIYAVLGDIDLDPCSTHDANIEFIKARKIYTVKEDGLNIEDPWTGKIYLFPPTYGRCSYSQKRGTWRWSIKAGAGAKSPSVIWFQRLLKEWKLRNVSEAIFFTIYPEMIRICPEIWEFPVCFPTKRVNLIHGKWIDTINSPVYWGYFIYLPKLEYGFQQIDKFKNVFSNLGKVVI